MVEDNNTKKAGKAAKGTKSASRGLGRGLNALLSADAIASLNEADAEQVRKIRINELSPNKAQPRQDFDPESLQELALSIESNGIVQPLLAVANGGGKGYTIVAGERRWRAARLAGLEEVPVIVRDLDDKEVQRISLIENLNREDLNQIEEAQALSSLLKEYNMTQEELARDIGRSRPAIANTLRLLKLPEAIQKSIRLSKLSAGHARALLALKTEESQLKLAERIINEDLSVRATERAVQAILTPRKKTKPVQIDEAQSLSVKTVEENISKALGTKVRFTYKDGEGSIVIRYRSLDDLQRLMELFGAEAD
ncbi:MAG TPA: ParB/RepB/Spo0J family partition protein [Clostridiaceae bacterium]|nr:ParB/RepB/Spo0J family partition protein [Clostridiaceae bacterium]